MLEKTLDLDNHLRNNKTLINDLKESLNNDKEVLKTENALVQETYSKYSLNQSLDTIRKLGFSLNESITLESGVTVKKSLLEKIKDLFKQKKILIENKNVRITDRDIPDHINNGEVTKEIFCGSYGFIVDFVNNNKIEGNDIISNYKSYLEKVEKYYNTYLSKTKLFEVSNLIDNKSNFIGHKFGDRLEILNSKSFEEVYEFDLNKIKLSDKNNGLNVIEYRYLILSFDVTSIIYVIKYCKSDDLYFTSISYSHGKFKGSIPTIKLSLTKEDIIKIMLEKSFDDKWFSLPGNSLLNEYDSKVKTFISSIDKILTSEVKYNKPLINKLGNTDFDYWEDHEIEDEYTVGMNSEIKKYLYNLCFDNFYDNIDQGHNGNILVYNFYWNIVANIIFLYQKNRLGNTSK